MPTHSPQTSPCPNNIDRTSLTSLDNSNDSSQYIDSSIPTADTKMSISGLYNWDTLHHNERTAGCRSEVGRKCYSLPNRYKSSVDQTHQSLNVFPTNIDHHPLPPSSSSNTQRSVSHEVFQKRLQLVKTWFAAFSDVQRNRLLTDILTECDVSQTHLLSTWLCGDGDSNAWHSIASSGSDISSLNNTSLIALVPERNSNGTTVSTASSTVEYAEMCRAVPPGGSRLHLGCPPNCQDPLTLLPTHAALHILQFLDPQSLARGIQVNRMWRWLCTHPLLWQRLAALPAWRLAADSHRAQIAKHSLNSIVNWKEVVVERWRVRRNWLGAHCHVRTFSGHTEGVTCVQFDQHRIVSASHDNTIKVWSMRTNSQWPVQTLVGHSGRVRCLHLSNNRIVSGAADATIKVWEVEETSEWSSIVCRVTMVGHTDTVRCLLVCGGNVVVSGSYDNTVRIWRLTSGQCEKTLRGHGGHVLSLAVVEEHQLIVSGSADNTIKLWGLETGCCVRTLHGHTDAVTSISADIHGLISGSLDSTIRSWDMDSGTCCNTVNWITSEGHTGVVRCVAADEWRVVSASDDKTIKVWERSTLKRLVTLRNHTDGVTCLAFNEFLIISGSYDKTVKLWDFSVC